MSRKMIPLKGTVSGNIVVAETSGQTLTEYRMIDSGKAVSDGVKFTGHSVTIGGKYTASFGTAERRLLSIGNFDVEMVNFNEASLGQFVKNGNINNAKLKDGGIFDYPPPSGFEYYWLMEPVYIVHNIELDKYYYGAYVMTILEELVGYGNSVFKAQYVLRPMLKGETTDSYPIRRLNQSQLISGQFPRSMGWGIGESYLIYPTLNNNVLNDLLQDLGTLPNAPTYPDTPDDEDDPSDDEPGDGDTSSDPVPLPPLPDTDVVGTGFVSMYNPSRVEIRQLAYFMWSGEFVDNIKKMFSAPFDALIGLKLIYSDVQVGAKQSVWLGNVETNVSMNVVTKQFVDMDMGTINITEFFGSFLDYAPYTKIHIYLPFIGYKELNVDEVMNAFVTLTYRIDVYTGSCIAFLKITKDIKSTPLDSILYQFDGNCAVDIPFTASDMSTYLSAILGMTASTAISLGASQAIFPNGKQSQAPPLTMATPTTSSIKTTAGVAYGALDVLNSKPKMQRSGSVSGSAASMCVKQPYIIIERAIPEIPNEYQDFHGIPLNATKVLDTLHGFTKVSKIFLKSLRASRDEMEMIEAELMNGVIL